MHTGAVDVKPPPFFHKQKQNIIAMKSNITSLITNEGKTLGPIEGSTRHMTIEITGTAGTITGAKSVNGEVFTSVDAYDFAGPTETFDIDVNARDTIVQLTTTGTFEEAWLITEG